MHNEEGMLKNRKKCDFQKNNLAPMDNESIGREQIRLGSRYHVEINDRESFDGILGHLKHNKGKHRYGPRYIVKIKDE